MLARSLVLIAAAVLILPAAAPAAVIQTTGAGSAVSSADRSATFDSIVTGTPLSGYTEDSLIISTSGLAYNGSCCTNHPSVGPFPGAGFSGGYHYPSGGNFTPTSISAADAAELYGIEFNVGDGWGGTDVNLYWEAYDDSVLVGSGSVTLPKGTVVGFGDPTGFDVLKVVATDPARSFLEGFQALALDNLRVDLHGFQGNDGGGQVPEPASLMLLGAGIIALGAARWRRR